MAIAQVQPFAAGGGAAQSLGLGQQGGLGQDLLDQMKAGLASKKKKIGAAANSNGDYGDSTAPQSMSSAAMALGLGQK